MTTRRLGATIVDVHSGHSPFLPRLVVFVSATVFAAQACAGSPYEPTSRLVDDVGFAIGQNVELVAGQTARLKDTKVVVKLIEAHGPRSGCSDCPLGAKLTVQSGDQTIELTYSYSAGMLPELLEKARRRTAFDYVFVAVKVNDEGFTLRVETP